MAQTGAVRRSAFYVFSFSFFCLTLLPYAIAQESVSVAAADSDQDGISDAVEQALLVQFAPQFMIGRHDCSKLPAVFVPDAKKPTVQAEDGTIYGQVFPAKSVNGDLPAVEIHFYHLWGNDCGPHGHHLDAEHVSALVSATDRDAGSAKWRAVYWYAAAHEDTVCDVSQITRASTLHAEESGAAVFVSPGKHASYLNEKLCRAGCGADKCVDIVAMPKGKIINLGEAAHPMNGSVFVSSTEWPLLGKMTDTDFPPEPVARLNQMPDTDIAWFNAGKHPAQGVIAVSNTTGQAIALGANDTSESLAKASASTDAALSVAQDHTGNALHKSFVNTVHALAVSVKHVGEALSPQKKQDKPQ
jgi:hypothetical protein